MNSSVGGVSEAVLLERQGEIAFVTINRPERLNTLDESLLASSGNAIDVLEHEASTNVVLITGAEQLL